jgi:hypothetical protein
MMKNIKVNYIFLCLWEKRGGFIYPYTKNVFLDIWEDIAEECSKFGTIVDMKIPRPNKEQPVPGCGLVSVLFLNE